MICSYKNNTCNIVNSEYTKPENFLYDFNKNGFVFLENAVNLDFNYKKHPNYSLLVDKINVVENYFPNDKEYMQIYKSFKTSLAFKLITENFKNLRLYNFMCFRLYKNSGSSSMHRDDDFAITYSLNTPFLICWIPLTNVPLCAGPLAIAEGDYPNNYTEKDRIEAQNYIKKYLHSSNIEENYEGIRKAMLNEEDYKIDVTRNHNTFITRPLKIGDAVIFSNSKVHGSLDNLNFLRSSVDLRFFYNCDLTNEPLLRATLDL